MTNYGGVEMEKEKAGGNSKGKRGSGPKARTWDQRKLVFQTIAVKRDLAQMATEVARDEGISVAELVDPMLRDDLAAMMKPILERKLKALGS